MQKIVSIFSLLVLVSWPLLTRAATPQITSISADMVSLADPLYSSVTFAIYGTDLASIVTGTQTVTLNGVVGVAISGNSTGVTLTFDIRPIGMPSGLYRLEVREAGTLIAMSEPLVEIVNIFSIIPDRKSVQEYFDGVSRKKISKQRIGLNVHYALGSSAAEDATLEQRLTNSHTKWTREHFSHEAVMGVDQAAWLKRYDKAMQFAVENNVRVVGMLAYGRGADDYDPPTQAEWQEFVDVVVNRYKNVVDVWEVWNEPDSADYLTAPTVATYVPLLRQASEVIRRDDPEAIILGGVLSSADASWAEHLFQKEPLAFDQLSVHIYECERWLAQAHFHDFDAEWGELERVVEQYRPEARIWVTELGCSMGSDGIGETRQRSIMKRVTNHLLNTGSVEVILLYTIRDRAYLYATDPYEAYFGLLEDDFAQKIAWKWYRQIPRQP